MVKTCSRCGHQNSDNALNCANCGKSFVVTPTRSEKPSPRKKHETRPTPLDSTQQVESDSTEQRLEARRAFFEGRADKPPPVPQQTHEVVLRFEHMDKPLVLTVTKQGLILGRTDPEGQVYPDVDLTPYGAERSGVSRRHARMVLNTSTYEIEIFDMNSTNGTYINNNRLDGRASYYLNQGDFVRLGKLAFQFFYRG